MYYLFLASIITTVIVYLIKSNRRNKKDDNNMSEYRDDHGNLTIKTNHYTYKMSKYDGRLYRKLENDNNYKLIFCQLDKITIPSHKDGNNFKNIIFDVESGKNIYV